MFGALIKEYKKSLKPANTEEFFDVYLYRPIAFLLVKLFMKTDITPNTITVFGMIWGILAGYFLSKGVYPFIIYGTLFYQLGNVFDCADGQLARLKKSYSIFGRILDGFVDYFNVTAVYIGTYIGFLKSGIYLHHEHYVLIIMVLASISTIITSVVYDKIKNRYIEIVKDKKIINDINISEYLESERSGVKKILLLLYQYYNNFQNFVTQNLNIKKVKKRFPFIENKDLYKKMYEDKNSFLLKVWGIVGPSAHAFYFFIFAINRNLLYYFLFISTILNIIFLVLSIIQITINRSINIRLEENKDL